MTGQNGSRDASFLRYARHPARGGWLAHEGDGRDNVRLDLPGSPRVAGAEHPGARARRGWRAGKGPDGCDVHRQVEFREDSGKSAARGWRVTARSPCAVERCRDDAVFSGGEIRGGGAAGGRREAVTIPRKARFASRSEGVCSAVSDGSDDRRRTRSTSPSKGA